MSIRPHFETTPAMVLETETASVTSQPMATACPPRLSMSEAMD
jgi:hypothetical protein